MRKGVLMILVLIPAILIVAVQFGTSLLGPTEVTRQAPVAATASKAAAAGFTLHGEPKPLPSVRFEDGEGRALDLASFRGRIVLLNMWATWCAPCRREMPTLDRLQQRLGGDDFVVVALSVDRSGDEAVRKFYAEIGVTSLAVYVDRSGKALRDLGVVGLPTTLLLDREQRELGRVVGPDEYDTRDWNERIGQLQRAGRS